MTTECAAFLILQDFIAVFFSFRIRFFFSEVERDVRQCTVRLNMDNGMQTQQDHLLNHEPIFISIFVANVKYCERLTRVIETLKITAGKYRRIAKISVNYLQNRRKKNLDFIITIIIKNAQQRKEKIGKNEWRDKKEISEYGLEAKKVTSAIGSCCGWRVKKV